MQVDADEAIEAFETAAEENRLSSMRLEQVVTLPAEGEVWMTGDLHDHRTNFAKLLRAADLGANPTRHLVLHELIHGDHYDPSGAEDSWQTLFRAAELKNKFSTQVHFLLANHDLAQIQGEGIMKAGLSVCEAFTAGLKRDFGGRGSMVNAAISDFLLSLPLAVRCPNGLFFCHSLPTDNQIDNFDFTVFDRQLTGQDYQRRVGPVYQLIWGRGMSPATAVKFAEKMGAKMLVTGHQPQDMGWSENGEQHLILASDHNQGVFLPLDLGQTYDMAGLVRNLRKFVAVDA
jgi:Calcineurin-like phosphoesterase